MEFQVIRTLKSNNDIIINLSDKGRAIVNMDRAQYITEGQRQLSSAPFYKPTDTNLTGEVIQRVNLHAHDMLQRG